MKKLKSSTLAYFLMVSVTVIPFLFSLIWQRQREEDFVFILINSAAMLFPLYFIKNHKIYFLLLFPLLLIPAFLDFGHIFLYQGRITESIFFILFDTSPAESSEYILSNLSWQLLSSVLLYLTAMIIYWVKILKMPKVDIEMKWWKYLLLWVLMPFAFKLGSEKGNLDKTVEAYRRSNHLYSMIHNYHLYQEEMKRFKAFSKFTLKDIKVERTFDAPTEEVHVLVLGESTTKAHMGIYGYQRDTTPELEKIKDKLHIFQDVVNADPPGTMANIKKIMTLANSEKETAELVGTNLVNIMKAAGFKTFWLSNQIVLGEHDTTTSVFAKQADIVQFGNTTNALSYDEKILPLLEQYLTDSAPKKFFVLHLIGTHMIYRYRYPEEFEKFVKTDDIPRKPFHNEKKLNYINYYDNAVFYHDYVVAKIFNRLMKLDTLTTVTYLSDHGEEVYHSKDLHGHPDTNRTLSMFQIPFFIWTSDKRDFSKYLNNKYVSDDTIHTLLDLFGITFKGHVQQKSVINNNFVEKPRKMGKELI